ncbi:immunity protein BlpZ [Streptococcus pneumoniae]|nr:immunity protein BlpZ [Streptococcus pneumoniae]
MYKHLFFLDSKTLDRLTPYILVLASDTIAFNVFVLTFVSAVVFNFLNSMLALMAIFIGAGYVVGFWLLILNENQQRANVYSIKIKEQTRKLAAGCSKYSFEVVDKTEVSSRQCFEVADRTDYIIQGEATVV